MNNFSKWYKWINRSEIPSINLPGIYALCITDDQIENSNFQLLKQICYFGMSVSLNGLKGRLRQFENAIKNGTWNIHGGAERVRFRYKDYNQLLNKLYVSVRTFDCDVDKIDPINLRLKGKIVEFEYICLAEYHEYFKELPEFNNMKRSPKKNRKIRI